MTNDELKARGFAADFIKNDVDEVTMLGNPHIDNLMTTVLALGAEIWADRKRVRIMEKLMAERGSVTPEMVEAYVPSAEEEAAWAAEREQFVRRVYGSFSRPADADKKLATPYEN